MFRQYFIVAEAQGELMRTVLNWLSGNANVDCETGLGLGGGGVEGGDAGGQESEEGD